MVMTRWLAQGCYMVVTTMLPGGDNLVTTLSQGCYSVNYQVVSRLLQGGDKVVVTRWLPPGGMVVTGLSF